MTRSEELFLKGAACSAAIFAAYAPRLGIDEATALKIATGLGGGVGRQREVCGVVTGLAMLASLKDGGDMTDPKVKERVYAVVQKMSAAYKARFGSIICRELLGLDKKAATPPKPEARTPDYYAHSHHACLACVAFGAALAEKHRVAQA